MCHFAFGFLTLLLLAVDVARAQEPMSSDSPVAVEDVTQATTSDPEAELKKLNALMNIQSREIGLLKRRLNETRRQLEENSRAQLIYRTQVEVAALRGFAITEPVRYEPMTDEVIHRLIDEEIGKLYPGRQLDLYLWTNQVFGALPEDIDLRRLYGDLMTEQAGGLYDPKRKVFYISPNFRLDTALGQTIVSHEICHALQDQNYGLIDLGLQDMTNADRSTAILALAEGDATLLMSEHMAAYGNPGSLLRDIPTMLTMDQSQLAEAPIAMREALLFPYVGGAKFFQELGGRTRANPDAPMDNLPDPKWRDAVWRDPPETVEQVIHPEKYLAREMPIEIEPLEGGFDATRIDSVVGELGIRLVLIEHVGYADAIEAAAGWNGDRLLATESQDGAERTLHWAIEWDTSQDADEAETAFAKALEANFGSRLNWSESPGLRTAESVEIGVRIVRDSDTCTIVEIRQGDPAWATDHDPDAD